MARRTAHGHPEQRPPAGSLIRPTTRWSVARVVAFPSPCQSAQDATSNMGAITENASMQIVEIDGEPATPQDLHRVAVMNYGHFTSMQVREGRVHGFELH